MQGHKSFAIAVLLAIGVLLLIAFCTATGFFGLLPDAPLGPSTGSGTEAQAEGAAKPPGQGGSPESGTETGNSSGTGRGSEPRRRAERGGARTTDPQEDSPDSVASATASGDPDRGKPPGPAAGETPEPDDPAASNGDTGPPGSRRRGERAGPKRPTATGTVIDQRTRAPLAGVRVLFVLRVGEQQPWSGGTTDAQGRYQVTAPRGALDDPGALELRLSMQGYRTAVLPTRGGAVDVELEPRDTPPLPGTIVGFATDAKGEPLIGVLLVTGNDETGANAAQWTIAGEDGSFRLEGVPAGLWTFRLSPGGNAVRARIDEDGETRLSLSGSATTDDERELARAAGYGSDYLDDSSLRGKIEQLQGEVDRILEQRNDPGRVAEHLQELRAELDARAMVRPVQITDVPDDPGTTVRLEAQHPRLFWRAVAVDGTASFAAVRGGTWTLVIARSDRPDLREPLLIPAGGTPFSAPSPRPLVEPEEQAEDEDAR